MKKIVGILSFIVLTVLISMNSIKEDKASINLSSLIEINTANAEPSSTQACINKNKKLEKRDCSAVKYVKISGESSLAVSLDPKKFGNLSAANKVHYEIRMVAGKKDFCAIGGSVCCFSLIGWEGFLDNSGDCVANS